MRARTNQNTLYARAGDEFAPAIARLTLAIERDREKARDLEQDIHAALWQSLASFDGRCALKTWVFRIAHNVAADHVASQVRRPRPVSLEAVEDLPYAADPEKVAAENHVLVRVMALIRQLPPLDAQVILLWLEGQSGSEIAEITGLNVNAAQVRIHRIKALLARAFEQPTVEGSDQ